MGIIFGVLQEEAERLVEVMELYRNKLKALPKGSLQIKKQNSKKYAYLAFRSGKQMKFKYIAPVPSREADELAKQVQERREYEKSISSMKKELDVIERTLKYAGKK